MKKALLYVTVLVVLQSCYSLKKTAITDVQTDKYYVMQLNNEMRVRGICNDISQDSLEFKIKHRLLKYAKQDIKLVRRKKISAVKSIGTFGILITAAVLSVTTNEQVSAFESTRPR